MTRAYAHASIRPRIRDRSWQKQRVLGPGAGIVQARFVGNFLYLLFADDTLICWSTQDFNLQR